MLPTPWMRVIGFSWFHAVTFIGLAVIPAQAIQYVVTDLGTLGGSMCKATGVNAGGEVVGLSYPAGSTNTHAFLYSGGTMQDLGTLGGTRSEATGINASGEVAGWSYPTDSSYAHAFLYSGGTMQDLGTFGGPYSWAWGINDSGLVVGGAYSTTGQTAFVYSEGIMQDLGTLGGVSKARGISSDGRITGYSVVGGATHAFLYDDGVMQDLGTLGGTHSFGLGVNANGEVVGYSHIAGSEDEYHAFLYSGGVMQDLGTFGGTLSRASGINASGQVVGWAYGADEDLRPFLYSGGVMMNLNTLLVPDSGWTLWEATAINDAGQIVGSGWNAAHENHAFLLTPVSGPSTNLAITSVSITDYDGNPITPTAGEAFYVRVDFEYDDPVCTPYRIRRVVNGWENLCPTVTWGCGGSGANFFWHNWGRWVMHHGGTYSVTVTLDPDHVINEADESDNTVTIEFIVEGTVTPEWALVKAEEGMNLLGDGTDVIVGTMDDALDFNHPWLAGNDSRGRPRLVAATQNSLGAGGSPVNANHATALMGIVLARGTNAGDITGLAPDARYVTAEFINRAQIPDLQEQDVLDAAGFLADHGAEVINMAWSWWYGSVNDSYAGEAPVTALMADYLAYGLDIVCVAAINQLPDHTRPTAPGSARNVIAAGGLDTSLQRAWIEQDSGPTLDGRCKPDLLGNNSEHAVALDPAWRNGFPAADGWWGVSFSVPFVTGAVAQMLDYGKHHGMSTDHRLIKAIIMNSGRHALDADGSPWANSSTHPLDFQQGTGIFDMVRCHQMYSAGQQSCGPVLSSGHDLATISGVADGGSAQGLARYMLGVPSGAADLNITLVWDRHTFWDDVNSNDQIDAGDSFYHLAEDEQDNLDLVLYRDGVELATSCSTVDNVEHISLSGLVPGYYEFCVRRLAVAGSGSDEAYAIAWNSDQTWLQTVRADLDRDGDVDQADFGQLQACLAGVPGGAAQGCLYADLNHDNFVDGLDVVIFKECLSGPGQPPDLECAQ